MRREGVGSPRPEGTPQGGPVSPLRSNVLLEELDKARERRGHRVSRSTDDCTIYGPSRRAGERILASIERVLQDR